MSCFSAAGWCIKVNHTDRVDAGPFYKVKTESARLILEQFSLLSILEGAQCVAKDPVVFAGDVLKH